MRPFWFEPVNFLPGSSVKIATPTRSDDLPMSTSAATAGYVAGNKFGLGLRPGELKQIQSDPRNWLRQQLQGIAQLPAALKDVEDSAPLLASAVGRLRDLNKAVQAGQRKPENADQSETMEDSKSSENTTTLRKALVNLESSSRQEQRQHLQARFRHAVTTEAPFAERLVRFWSNHFTVAEGGQVKRAIRDIAVPYENEAIRAHLNGSFADLLLAVEQHPAMLIYLDNIQSIGPSSRLAKRGNRGLNENLAREILELHTLGVDGGYTQTDVTTLAKIITGWTIGGLAENRLFRFVQGGEPGRFRFTDLLHEGGTQTLLGKAYAQQGVKQGEAALRDLAVHPATAHFIATKLARHFVADHPPAAAVAKLEKVFMDTHGDLPSVHAALIELEAAWDDDNRKLKTPEEFVISLGRGIEVEKVMDRANRNFLMQALTSLGQVPFTAASPAGWSDMAEYWGSADALIKRIEWTSAVAERVGSNTDVPPLYPQLLPEQNQLKQELTRAASNTQALALLLASPQFQWR